LVNLPKVVAVLVPVSVTSLNLGVGEFAVSPQHMATVLNNNGSTFSLAKHGVNVAMIIYAIQTEVASMTSWQ